MDLRLLLNQCVHLNYLLWIEGHCGHHLAPASKVLRLESIKTGDAGPLLKIIGLIL